MSYLPCPCVWFDDGGDIWYMSYLPWPGVHGLMMMFDIWVISLAQVRVGWWWLWWSRRWWVTLTPSGTVPARCSPSTSGNDSANTPRSPNSWSSEGNREFTNTNIMSLLDKAFQPVLHDWCNKGRGMCYTVCGDGAYKRTLAANRKE